MSQPTEYLTADQLTEGYYWCVYPDAVRPVWFDGSDGHLYTVGEEEGRTPGHPSFAGAVFLSLVPPARPPEVTEAWLRTVGGLTVCEWRADPEKGVKNYQSFSPAPAFDIALTLGGCWALFKFYGPDDTRVHLANLLTREDVLLAVKLFGGTA